ncbi:uncharacterized protein YeeX (DUF496 family) [Chryseobacterium sp. H1D6B]|uniref:lantibiotic dehydratase family protein n=1 Tax=Chryseobacterium sp. H1D6B TaxID=2940588 RepID=UPI0015C99FCE|nr:lantibiotic dehydratase family protein [Chryseobacterium sp. H1D6B]MDH6252211.1 uncharacterized protein YeeX (DUF496 family) [Chryseobacterium sp. H1D6B]
MAKFPYQFFDKYIVRTPLFSYQNFKEKMDNNEISDQALKEMYSDPIFKEAVYLASPDLHEELDQWLYSEKQASEKKYQKLKNSLLKYYSRMSTRCTPFGLFAGVGLGEFENEKRDEFFSLEKTRDTKLDMYFLVALSKDLLKVQYIRNQVLFFPNNSIYKVGNKIRYIEYEYSDGKRDYIVSSAPLSKELELILNFSKEGKTYEQIKNLLVNDEITVKDAEEFLDELIDNQVLISELEPNVSGSDFLAIIISVLSRIGAGNESDILTAVQKKLRSLDLNIGNSVSLYSEIEDLIQSLNIQYERQYLFQTDLYFEKRFDLSRSWKKEIKYAVSFLNKISFLNKETYLEKFKKSFYERFESKEVPLAYALDVEIGIGYRQDVVVKGMHPYLQDLTPSFSKEKQILKIQLDPVQLILNEKLQDALLENAYSIELADDDFKDFNEIWEDLPDTLSLITEIVSENHHEKLIVESGGGSSAANLLARFCSERSEIKQTVRHITEKEEELNPDFILAEVIHLPETRTGNVIRRPTLRKYEIPYLAQSVLPIENQIPIEDLYISLKNNRIILRSKKLNREIKPYLTNAHNYTADSLPVYHFLCDLHSQDVRTGLYLNWGSLKSIYNFLPRVEYKDIILSRAQWKVTEKELKRVLLLINEKEQLFLELAAWRNKRQIPQWIQWVRSDNKLIVNLENYDLVKMFIDAVKNNKSIQIEEFLYHENDDFSHQFIFSMHKTYK